MEFNKKEIFKIIGSSLIEATKWSLWKWFATGSIGALSSTLLFGEKFFGFDIKKSVLFAFAALLLLYLARFFLIAVIKSMKYYHEVYKNSNYGEAIVLLKDCFAEVHYYRKTSGFQEDEFMKSMMIFCNNLKVIFDSITKSDCSVSIKVPVKDDHVKESSVLKNLTRDTSHRNRDTAQYMSLEHSIIGNTPFNNSLNKVITNNPKKAYLNNDIANTNGYLNTSKDLYQDGVLPYKSELVHPITPIKIASSKKNYDCHGFLCIDSNKLNAFEERYAPALIEGVCDGIYDLILELNKSKNGKTIQQEQ